MIYMGKEGIVQNAGIHVTLAYRMFNRIQEKDPLSQQHDQGSFGQSK